MIRRVDSRFFITDDGRLIFRTLRHFVVIPESDLGLVRRRNFQANALGVVAVILSNIGWPQTYWRPWWLAIGIGVWIAAYVTVSRWVRERYLEADFANQRELRSAIDRGDPRTIGSDVLSALFALLSALIGLTDPKPRSPFVLLLLLSLLQFTGAFWRWKRASRVDSEAN